jgi:hypothetical protein
MTDDIGSTTPDGDALTRLCIFITDTDRSHGKPLAREITQRAHDHAIATIVVLHAIEGFGASGLIHTDRLLSMSIELPMVIVVVDSDSKIGPFVTELDDLITDGLLTIDRPRGVVPRPRSDGP